MTEDTALLSIRATSDTEYTVSVQDESGAIHEFAFVVNSGDIEVLEGSRGFYEFMNFSTGHIKPLYEAIMAFHNSRVFKKHV